MIKFASAGNRGSLFLIGGDASEIYFNHSEALPTILVKTFGTLCVLGDENVIQVDHPTPPPPPQQCWVLQVKHLLHIFYTLWTSTLFRRVGEKSC